MQKQKVNLQLVAEWRSHQTYLLLPNYRNRIIGGGGGIITENNNYDVQVLVAWETEVSNTHHVHDKYTNRQSSVSWSSPSCLAGFLAAVWRESQLSCVQQA